MTADAVPVCCSEEKPEGVFKTIDLLVNLIVVWLGQI